MNEERDILLAKATEGTLEGDALARWESLCAEDPGLKTEAESLAATATHLHDLIHQAEEKVELPQEVPAAIRDRLEAARKEAFTSTGESVDAGERDKIVSFFSRLQGGGSLLAAAAAVAVFAGGWWIWQGQGNSGPVIAVIKDLTISSDLPMTTPGKTTNLTDPPVTWMTFDSKPVSVTVLSSDGKKILFSAAEQRPPVAWGTLQPEKDHEGAATLKPGETYLFRIEQEGLRTERLVEVAENAKALTAWTGGTPAKGRQQAEDWLAEGQASDALALAASLAKAFKDVSEDFSDIRTRALTQALADGEPKGDDK